MPRQLRFLVIGAGSRGTAYANAVTALAEPAVIHAVAEPHDFKRRLFGERYIWGEHGAPRAGQSFCDWRDWLAWEEQRRHQQQQQQREAQAAGWDTEVAGVDGVFVCTLDETHAEIIEAIAPLGLHILCEKPLALSLADCLRVYRSLSGRPGLASSKKIFSIGHVLRYSPHNLLLRKLLLEDRVVGDIVSLEHCEPVGWWHFSHSYVRGNWRRETAGMHDGSLLTKSCHDIDFILWLMSASASASASPPPSTMSTTAPSALTARDAYHAPRSISSFGSLTQFRKSRKPRAAGSATNCLSCPAERECKYSALRIYRDMHLRASKTGWPVNIVCPDIEDVFHTAGLQAAEDRLLSRLAEDYGDSDSGNDAQIASRAWYGRCVFEADNSVCDDQAVTIIWDDDDSSSSSTSTSSSSSAADPPAQSRKAKTAIFHMIAPTEKQCQRRGVVYGTDGEVTYDGQTISIYDFASARTTAVDVSAVFAASTGQQTAEAQAQEQAAVDITSHHGGGDYGLARAFVRAVDAVENRGWDVRAAQDVFVGCSLESVVRSHAVVFAAEEARREEKVIRWKSWWDEKASS